MNEKLKYELTQEIKRKTGVNGYVTGFKLIKITDSRYTVCVDFKPSLAKVVNFYDR